MAERYGVRAFPITKGDLVKVKSGKRKGEGGKVSFVDHSEKGIQVEGINIAKADGKEKQFLIRPDFTLTKSPFVMGKALTPYLSLRSLFKLTLIFLII